MGSFASESAEALTAKAPRCRACDSLDLARFTGEVVIHFPGLRNIDKPHVFVFPKLVVCLVCGLAQFVVGEEELRLLAGLGAREV
jgi:hypothetical protein